MTQDEIIRSPLGHEQLVALAREAGFTGCLLPEEADNLIGGVFIDDENLAKPLERFAALVAAHERENVQMVRAITLEEAAQLCMDYGREGFSAHVIARAIREMK